MKIQKIHLLVVFLLLIAFSVYVLRPSIYPLSHYEYATAPSSEQNANIQVALGCNPKKSGVCKALKNSGALQAHIDYIADLERERDLNKNEQQTRGAIEVSKVEDPSAKIGLLQTQINLLEKNLTERTNRTIDTQIKRVDAKIDAALMAIDELLDEDGNILVDKIQNTDLGIRIKEVIAQDRGSELVGLRADIDTNKESINTNKADRSTELKTLNETINTNKTQHSSNLNTLSEIINKKINEYQNTNAVELSTLGDAIDNTNDNIQAANSDIKSVQAELEGVDLEQLTYYVGNNIVQIADLSKTVATIIPYTEFRDDLRDTYRQQYLSHLDTEH